MIEERILRFSLAYLKEAYTSLQKVFSQFYVVIVVWIVRMGDGINFLQQEISHYNPK
jgi:hypothetical protein